MLARAQTLNNNQINNDLPQMCQVDLSPQQSYFTFTNGLVFDSQFDSGNLYQVDQISENEYECYISPDCNKTAKENIVTNGYQEQTITITIKNLNFQVCFFAQIAYIIQQQKLFKEGMAPVYLSNQSNGWARVKSQIIIKNNQTGVEITFTYTFDHHNDAVYFAFTYPWTYSQNEQFLDKIEKGYANDGEIFVQRDLLGYTIEKRRIELLIISSQNDKKLQKIKFKEPLFPDKERDQQGMINFYKFPKKKAVIFSARVHPGELPSSHVLNGIINFLLDRSNNQSNLLRANFVFYIIPLLNPDGVYRGHYRTDNSGTNLNRCYINPNQLLQPSIFCTKELILQVNQSQGLAMYLDLHAHAGKKGCFIFGNQLDFRNQIETCLFTKLLSLNCPIFDYNLCNFTEQNMYAKDKSDNGVTKEGSGRVSIYKATNVVLCYTLECNYNMSERYNVLFPWSSTRNEEEKFAELGGEIQNWILNEKPLVDKLYSNEITEPYNAESYEELGRNILQTLLDYYQLSTVCRYRQSPFQSIKNLKLHLAVQIMKNSPFRFDPFLRKFIKNFTREKNILPTLKQLYVYLEKNIKVDDAFFEEKKPKSNQKKKLKNGGAVINKANGLKKINIIFNEIPNARSNKELSEHIVLRNYTKQLRGMSEQDDIKKLKKHSALSELKKKQDKNQQFKNDYKDFQSSEKKKYGKLPKLSKLPARNDNNNNTKLYSIKF